MEVVDLPRGRPVAQSQPVRHQLRRSGPAERLLGNRRRDLSRPRDRHRVGRGRRPTGRPLAAAERRPSVRRSPGQAGRIGRKAGVRPPGVRVYAIAPGDPRSAAERVLREFASRAFRRPVATGRGRAVRQAGAPGARRRPGLRGRAARGVPRRDHVAEVPVSRRASRPARRLGAGVAGCRISSGARSRTTSCESSPPSGTLQPARDPARSGRADAGLPQVAGVRRELRRPVARPEADRFHPARPEALPGIRRHPEGGHGRRDARVLRARCSARIRS